MMPMTPVYKPKLEYQDHWYLPEPHPLHLFYSHPLHLLGAKSNVCPMKVVSKLQDCAPVLFVFTPCGRYFASSFPSPPITPQLFFVEGRTWSISSIFQDNVCYRIEHEQILAQLGFNLKHDCMCKRYIWV